MADCFKASADSRTLTAVDSARGSLTADKAASDAQTTETGAQTKADDLAERLEPEAQSVEEEPPAAQKVADEKPATDPQVAAESSAVEQDHE